MKGIVSKSTGSWYRVLLENGSSVDCRLKGKFKQENRKVTNPIAVGDKVEVELPKTPTDSAVITRIGPRENYMIRKSPRKKQHAHVIAANIDRAYLVASLKSPRTSTGFIDRYLVSAELYHIPAAIIFNKVDLLGEELNALLEQLTNTYESLDYPVYHTSVPEKIGLDQLVGALSDKINLFSGHSGVGKSSILNEIAPHARQAISEVSSYADKGTHTTTFAEMFAVQDQAFIIDTPGIKEFGLIDIEPDEVGLYFPEMKDLLEQCKFYNCTHIHEPGCAVRQAVEEGDIAESRYKSYVSMYIDEDNRR